MTTLIAMSGAGAQHGLAQARFEVTSVRPVVDLSGTLIFRVTATGELRGRAPLAAIIRMAYEVQPYERITAADDAVSDRLTEQYEVRALPPRATPPPSRADVAAMTRGMLQERFGLQMRVETELADATVLRVARAGAPGRGLRPAAEGCQPLPPGVVSDEAYRRSCVLTLHDGRIRGTATLDDFAFLLSSGGQRPFLNETNLDGPFVFDVEVAMASWFTVYPMRETGGPALLDALRGQMGLAAVRERRPVRVFIAERVGRLVEN